MSIFRVLGKTGRFIFIKAPLATFGITGIRAWNHLIRDLYLSSFGERLVCPSCNQGLVRPVLAEDSQIIEGGEGKAKVLYPWNCDHCEFHILAPNDRKEVKSILDRCRATHILETVSTLEQQEIERLAAGHKFQSRFFFAVSCLVLSGFAYMLATSTIMVAMNWLAIAFVLWVYGMKKSYRYWQVMTRTLYQSGSFWFWFKNSRWLV